MYIKMAVWVGAIMLAIALLVGMRSRGRFDSRALNFVITVVLVLGVGFLVYALLPVIGIQLKIVPQWGL